MPRAKLGAQDERDAAGPAPEALTRWRYTLPDVLTDDLYWLLLLLAIFLLLH